MPEVVLSADGVLRRLLAALDPLHAQVEAAGGTNVRYVVQARPLAVQIVKPAEGDRPAERKAFADPLAFTDDGGQALAAAVDEMTAGGLASMRPEVAAALLADDATREDGGLVIVVDPVEAGALLVHAAPGVPLDQATPIISIGEAMTLH